MLSAQSWTAMYLFLDRLRKSGEVNMFHARPHLMKAFPELSEQQAAHVLVAWMKSYEKRSFK